MAAGEDSTPGAWQNTALEASPDSVIQRLMTSMQCTASLCCPVYTYFLLTGCIRQLTALQPQTDISIQGISPNCLAASLLTAVERPACVTRYCHGGCSCGLLLT